MKKLIEDIHLQIKGGVDMAIVTQKRDGFSEFVMRHCAGGRLSAFLLAAFICPAAALAEVVTEPLADHPEWGYTVSGLGEDGNETALRPRHGLSRPI